MILDKYGLVCRMMHMLPSYTNARNNYQNILYREYLLKAYQIQGALKMHILKMHDSITVLTPTLISNVRQCWDADNTKIGLSIYNMPFRLAQHH